MERPDISEALDKARDAVEAGEGVKGTGFWSAVAAVKKEPELAADFGADIAAIDDASFRDWALLVVPLWVGNTLMILGTIVGLALVGWAYSLDGLAAVIAFLVGFGALTVTTHGLAHLVVGSAVGIQFTAWYIGTIGRPQPGVKIDYQSYLVTPPKQRAWMHASGAVMTKALPFLLIGAAVGAGLPGWVSWLLVAVGVVTIVTDVLWSTKKSDWAKYKREMSFI